MHCAMHRIPHCPSWAHCICSWTGQERTFVIQLENLAVMQDSIPRGVIEVEKCLSIKGAEDVINKPHAFEISTHAESMYFIADTDKEKVGVSG
jgi:hypothetical protein